jgi:hypothetical protein
MHRKIKKKKSKEWKQKRRTYGRIEKTAQGLVIGQHTAGNVKEDDDDDYNYHFLILSSDYSVVLRQKIQFTLLSICLS